MPTYNQLSVYLQLIINFTLLSGFALLLKRGRHSRKLLFIFLLGEIAAELPDLIFRLTKVNTVNVFIYPVSQSFSLLIMTEIYHQYFFKIPHSVRWMIYFFSVLILLSNLCLRKDAEPLTFYFSIITDLFICTLAATYFMHIFKNPEIDRALLSTNIIIFLFFSIESVISTTFSFLTSHHVQWVAPIWLFRGVILWILYINFINLGWKSGEMNA